MKKRDGLTLWRMNLSLFILACCLYQAHTLSQLRFGTFKSTSKSPCALIKQQLLEVVKDSYFGLKSSAKSKEDIAKLVDDLAQANNARNPANAFSSSKKPPSPLYGTWDLQYTDAPDVLSIGKIPGVQLLYVGQDISKANTITNVIEAKGFLADSRQEVVVGATQER